MMENFNKASQDKKYDFFDYINIERWASYYYQIKEILKCKPKSVLEIGPGSGIIRSILKKESIDYFSSDIDKNVNPDFFSDVRKLSKNIDKKFDVVIAFQVLEHLPYKFFKESLSELNKISKKNVIISLPVNGISYGFHNYISKKIELFFSGKIPFYDTKLCKEHYWEINYKNYSLSRIKKDISQKFNIINQYHCKENPYHYFFILKKK